MNAATHLHPLTVVLNRRRDQFDLTRPRVIHLLDHLPRLRLRVLERLSDIVHRCEREPLPLEPVEPVLRRVLGERGRDQGDQARPVRDPGRVGRKVRVLDPLWVLQQVGELGELAVCARGRIESASDLFV